MADSIFTGDANATPIWGIERDLVTMEPIAVKKDLIFGDPLSYWL